MVGFILFLFGVLVTLGTCFLAARSDFKGYKIPNIYSVIIVAVFLVTFGGLELLGQREIVFRPIGNHLGAAFLVFMVTLAMFALKQLGAGDSKFATAIALWVGLHGLVPFLFYMALSGGVIGAVSIILRKKKLFVNSTEGGWIDMAQKGHGAVPYGIAIAVGAFVAFIYMGYFSPDMWTRFF